MPASRRDLKEPGVAVPGSRLLRRRLKLAAFALTPALVLFLLFEILASFAITRRAEVVVDAKSGAQRYEFQMGRFPWSHSSTTPLNSDGFPDVEFSSVGAKPAGCRHVVFVGDSFTFGDGVDLSDNFVSRIRRAWSDSAAAKKCVRVFNLGRRATSIAQQLHALEKTWDRLAPDVVVLTVYQNDLTDLEFDTAAVAKVAEQGARKSLTTGLPLARWRPRIPAFDVAVVRWLTYVLAEGLTKASVKVDMLARWSFLADPARVEEATQLKRAYEVRFDSLVTLVQSRGSKLGVVAIPSKFDVLAKRSPEVDFFVGLANGRRLPTLSVFPVFNEKRSEYPYLRYDGHLNPKGNAIVAAAILSWMRHGEGSSLLR